MQRPFLVPRVVAVSALFAVAAFAQAPVVNPAQVSLAAPVGSTTPAVATVSLTSTGAAVSFDATVRYLGTTIGWLSVGPPAGTTPATLTISADASQLSAGTYSGQVVVSAGPLHLGAIVSVMFTVGSGSGPGRGSVIADPTSLTFVSFYDAQTLPPVSLSVRSPKGAVAFTTSATSSGNWLVVSPPAGPTPTSVSVGVIQQGLTTGTYNGTVTLTPTDGSGAIVVPVSFAVVGSLNVSAALLPQQSAVTINAALGDSTAVQGVDLVTAGGALPYTAATGSSWIKLATNNFPTPVTSLSDNAPGQLRVIVDPAGLTLGTYVDTVTITPSGLAPLQVPVYLTVTNQPALNVNPSSLTFGDTAVTSATVTVTATTSANISYSATPSPNTPWLSVTPNLGSTGAGGQLTISVNPAGLTAGTQTGSITVTPQGSAAAFIIPVRLKVNPVPAGAGTLVVPFDPVILNGVVGAPDPSQTVSIGNTSVGTHPFTASASSNEGWLSVDPFSTAAPATLRIGANQAAVPAPGTYQGTILLTSLITGAQNTITVTYNLAGQAIIAAPSSLSFTQTQRGVPPPPQTLQLQANAPSSFTVQSPPSWIKVNPLTGTTPSTLTVTVDPAGLATGMNTGSILISGPKNLLTVPVSLTVPEPPGPTVSPANVSLSYQIGGPAPATQIAVASNTGASVPFAASAITESGIRWLSVTPSSGSTPATVLASVNPSLVVPGRQAGSVIVSNMDGSVQRTIPLTLDVVGTTVVVQALLHSATLAPTAVAPGQIVSLTGTGLGPATGVAAKPSAAGAIDTTLSSMQVYFDGTPAPLLYASSNQINAIVPYAVFGRATTKVQVVSAGKDYSIPIDVKVVDAAPGLFTSGSTGAGPAAALNSDLTVNSLANPAARGSVVVLYGTGEGQTNPSGQDGRLIATDLRRPLLPVTATIGGKTADVVYAGSAPSLVSGVLQVNLRVPLDIDPGTATVEVQVGGVPTQAGVTVAVK